MPESSLTPPGIREEAPLKLMTWNVQHASAERAIRQVAWIASQAVDGVVLTEVPGGRSGDVLTHALTKHGYTTYGAGDNGTSYGALIAMRQCELQPLPSIRANYLPHRCVAARVHLDDCNILGLLGLYVPSRGSQARRNVDKRAFQNAIATMLPRLQASFGEVGLIVIAGDLNVLEPGHQPHHAVFGCWEYSFYRAFQDVGYVDAYRHVRPSEHQHSWYGRSGTGYRFDHMFISDPGHVVDCYYDHHPREVGLSDHSAMILLARVQGGGVVVEAR